MRASFTDARGNSPRDAPKQRYPSAAADELSAEDQAEISRAGLQSSAAASRQKRNSAAQGGGYQQPKPLELTVHSIRMLAHEQKDRHVLPGAQLGNLPAEVYARAKLTASTVTFDWSHTLKLDAQGQEAGVLRDALFPRRTDGQKAPPRLPVTASSEVPDSVRKAFTMFDFDHSGDIDSRELRKALEAMGMETDESQTRGVLAKCVLARPLVASTHTPRTPPVHPPMHPPTHLLALLMTLHPACSLAPPCRFDRSGKGTLTLVEFHKLVMEILAFQKKQEVRSPCDLHAISMPSPCHLHAISMPSPCHLRAISMQRRTRRRCPRTCARPSQCSTRTGAATSTDTSSSKRCGSWGWRRTRRRRRASFKSTTRRAAASWTWPRSTSW